MWLLEKQPLESFAKFLVNFQDVTSFGKFLKNLIQISVKFWEKRKSDENSNKTLELFWDFEKILSKL